MIDASGWSYYNNDPLWGVTGIHRQTGYDLSYRFDKAGNLLQIAGPVTVNYTYDALNRLTTVSENNSGTASYSYDNVGNLQSVTYPNGVVHNYSYDVRNRLTSETIAGDTHGMNGAASYVYDPVGNRAQKTSTLPRYPGGLSNYNANDELSTDTGACPERSRRDANGNITASIGQGYVCDFENYLIQAGGVTNTYTKDWHRAV
jgi:YD repeat-containing protein